MPLHFVCFVVNSQQACDIELWPFCNKHVIPNINMTFVGSVLIIPNYSVRHDCTNSSLNVLETLHLPGKEHADLCPSLLEI